MNNDLASLEIHNCEVIDEHDILFLIILQSKRS